MISPSDARELEGVLRCRGHARTFSLLGGSQDDQAGRRPRAAPEAGR